MIYNRFFFGVGAFIYEESDNCFCKNTEINLKVIKFDSERQLKSLKQLNLIWISEKRIIRPTDSC